MNGRKVVLKRIYDWLYVDDFVILICVVIATIAASATNGILYIVDTTR